MVTPVGFADVAISLKHSGDVDPWWVTYGVETDLASFSPLEHANQQLLAFVEAWDARVDANVTIGPAVCRFGQDGPGDLIVESDITPQNGNNAATMAPQNCAALIKKNTGLGGRTNRGRCFFPAVLQVAEVSEVGVMSSTMKTNLQNAADTWLEAVTFGATGSSPLVPTPMVILHGPTVSGTLATPTPVTSLTVDATISTQRRRLRR